MDDRTNWLTIFPFLFSICFRVLESTSAWAADSNVWETSINLQTRERYIPVELWTGADWDGTKELKMAPVDGTYRHRTSTYYIKGPTDWKHPVTGQTSRVYERINPDKNRSEDKTQLFTINQDQTGLGRLFDGRPGRDTRTYSGGLKFPLGLWKEGESNPSLTKCGTPAKRKGWRPSRSSGSISVIRAQSTVWKFIGSPPIDPAGRPTTATLISTAQGRAW
jgi:hypothetical protein